MEGVVGVSCTIQHGVLRDHQATVGHHLVGCRIPTQNGGDAIEQARNANVSGNVGVPHHTDIRTDVDIRDVDDVGIHVPVFDACPHKRDIGGHRFRRGPGDVVVLVQQAHRWCNSESQDIATERGVHATGG
ncbi:hypothetical protein D3C79_641200 [compost metagenome]